MSMKTKSSKNEQQLLKNIQSGKYKDYYLIYTRKSTDEANNQKNSISYQKTENIRFAQQENLPLAQFSLKGFSNNGIISERHSGFKEDDALSFTKEGLVQYRIERPKFQKMLQYLNKGCFKGVVALCWDRISRNKGDDTIIRKLMRRGIDVQFVYAKYDNSSSGALHMDIDGMFSQHHSRVTSEKVRLTTHNNRSKGICTYRAPIGYLNIGKMEQKPLDPKRAPIIKEMFQLYATGSWSLSDLARYANKQGMKTVPMRRRRTKEELLDENIDIKNIQKVSRSITENHVSRILSNLFYTGRIKGSNGEYIMSKSHQALVDNNLFNQVQQMLKSNTVSAHYIQNLDIPLRGMIRCNTCNRVYSPYIKKGIQYYSSRCKEGCTNTLRNFNFKYIAEALGEKIKQLHFHKREIAFMDSEIDTKVAMIEERRYTRLKQIERKKRKIREDLTYLRSNKLDLLKSKVYSLTEYIEQEDKLSNDLSRLQEQEQISDEAMHETMKDIIKLSELMQDVAISYDIANPYEKEKIIKIIFSELYICDKTLKYKVHRGLECLEKHFHAVCEPTAWISELSISRIERKHLISALSELV